MSIAIKIIYCVESDHCHVVKCNTFIRYEQALFKYIMKSTVNNIILTNRKIVIRVI